MREINPGEFVASQAKQIAADKEEIINRAISEFLGHHNWAMVDVLSRGEVIIKGDHETFIFDGVPLVQFEKIQKCKDGFNVVDGFRYTMVERINSMLIDHP